MANKNTNRAAALVVTNQHVKDSGAKLIFKDPILCAEFLRGYVDIDILKDVRPEDIEDISLHFTPTPRTPLRGVERMCKFNQSDTHLAVGDFKYGCRPLQFTRIRHKKWHKLAYV